MSSRRLLAYSGLAVGVASLCFTLGAYSAQHSMSLQLAENDARIAALRDEMARNILQIRQSQSGRAAATDGTQEPEAVGASRPDAAPLVEEIKRQLQSEMGLLPVRLLRERRQSFVELNAYDNFGKSSYGTAGYLGNGYFITVKHGVIALGQEGLPDPRKITSIKLMYDGRPITAKVVDSGDARVEVDPGDWAILKVKETIDLPSLTANLSYQFEFADPIFRLGNDYSKGIIVATGYVGQKTPNSLVTCLTDGHPGVSGGGVLNAAGQLVGIPIGRMQGDYRFSFILPLRDEMFRRVKAESATH
jgi:S1-C subfamily serine protease